MAGVIATLALLGFAFRLAEAHSPTVVVSQSTCLARDINDCTSCLHQVCRPDPEDKEYVAEVLQTFKIQHTRCSPGIHSVLTLETC